MDQVNAPISRQEAPSRRQLFALGLVKIHAGLPVANDRLRKRLMLRLGPFLRHSCLGARCSGPSCFAAAVRLRLSKTSAWNLSGVPRAGPRPPKQALLSIGGSVRRCRRSKAPSTKPQTSGWKLLAYCASQARRRSRRSMSFRRCARFSRRIRRSRSSLNCPTVMSISQPRVSTSPFASANCRTPV